MQSPTLDEIAEKLVSLLPPGARGLQQELEKNFRAVLQSSFEKLDLVSREEFEVQAAVLARTREKLEQLEKLVSKLEKQAGWID